jgi:uracil-DNA glycosylase family 4
MVIEALFNEYRKLTAETNNILDVFSESGMQNEFAKLSFGFFPLGSGVLSDNSKIEKAKIDNCEIMILGNDFGTIEYLKNFCPDNREKETNPTIRNLKSIRLNLETTFFTNLFLGLRTTGKNTDSKKISKEYKQFCFKFFEKQLELINPKIIICLGSTVSKSLSSYSSDFFQLSKHSMSKLYADSTKKDFIIYSGKRKYILIPHPSYAHINWNKNDIRQKIKDAIKSH